VAADPPLDERERVEGHRWIFSLLAVAETVARLQVGRERTLTALR